MTADLKTFKLKSKRACLTGKRNKEKYLEYRNEYRFLYGVFPELDKIHNPFTAKVSEVYDLFCNMRKSGVAGALYYHDLHNRFRRRISRIYEAYGNEWSLVISLERSYLEQLTSMPMGDCIKNNLGYRVDENHNYYEGTWKNGSLIYGLVYLAESNQLFVGSFDKPGSSICRGICAPLTVDHEHLSGDRYISAGCFRLKNGTLSPYESDILTVHSKWKKGENVDALAVVGKYVEGYEQGSFLTKDLDDYSIAWARYKEGEMTAHSHWVESIPRTLMMLYFCVWLLFKYVHGSMFFITPLYYIIRKKRWKV